jgi:aryl-alcohol dehydrogenase-like predicted oxidoreductase
MARTLNVGVTAWSPLAGGLLTGKYHGSGDGGGASGQGRFASDMMKEFLPDQKRTQRVVEALKSVSDQVGRPMAQVALAWLRYRPIPVIPIIGARKLSQLRDNLVSVDLELSPDHVKVLDDASAIEPGFPERLYAMELPRTFAYGGMRDRIIT